jgi:hypothetical protein
MSGLQVGVMKFVGFDGKGEIWHKVILDYHIDEMGFLSGTQSSSSSWAFDNQGCILIAVNDGEAPGMYCWYSVRWGLISIINDGTSSLWCSWGCIGGQDGLSMDSWIPHLDWFLTEIRVMQRCEKWWVRQFGNSFAKEDMAQ